MPVSPPIELTLAGHTFRFKRLTWRDEVRFSLKHPEATRKSYTAMAMTTVDGIPATYEQSLTILEALPRPICDRVIIYYMGSLPPRRKFDTEIPYSAPEASYYTQRVEEDEEASLSTEEETLNRTFGEDEVAEAKDLAMRMAKGTHFAGVSRVTEVEEEAPKYDAMVT